MQRTLIRAAMLTAYVVLSAGLIAFVDVMWEMAFSSTGLYSQ